MANTSVTITGRDATAAAFNSLNASVSLTQKRFETAKASVASFVGVFGIGFLVQQITKSLEFADSISELAKRTGLTTKATQELQFAFNQNGASADAYERVMGKFVQTVGEAAAGSRTAVDALKAVGITQDDLKKKNIEQLWVQTSDALSHMSSEAQRAAAANALMGKSYKDAGNAVALSRDELVKLRTQAESTGAVLDSAVIKRAKETKDEMQAASKIISVQLTDAFVSLAPFIVKVLQEIAPVATMIKEIAQQIGLIDAISFDDRYDTLLKQRMDLSERLLVLTKEFVKEGTEPVAGGFVDKARKDLAALDAQLDSMRKEYNTRQTREKSGVDPETGNATAAAADKIKEQKTADQAAFDQLRASLDAKYAAEADYEAQLKTLKNASNAGLITDQRVYDDTLRRIELEHLAKLGDMDAQAQLNGLRFQQLTDMQKLQSTLKTGAQMTAGVANTSRAMFNINKALSLAQAVVALPSAIMQSFENGGGYPYGLIPAGLMLATGLAQISAIASARFGSSTSAASIGGGHATPVTPATNFGEPPGAGIPTGGAQAPQRVVNVHLTGDGMLSQEYIRKNLIPALNEAAGDGVLINAMAY